MFFGFIFLGLSLLSINPWRSLPSDAQEDQALWSVLTQSSERGPLTSVNSLTKWIAKHYRDRFALVERPTLAKELAGLIHDLSKKHRFSKEFLLALIQVESRFDPWAESRKGAQGLLQLMPETAQWFVQSVRSTGLKYLADEANSNPFFLYDPEVNLKIGVAYLAYLRDRYDGDPRAYLSAFNAGPHRFEKGRLRGEGFQDQYLRQVKSSLLLSQNFNF